jgi:hypothetical protein
MSMSLAGSRFSSESAPGPLYGAFLSRRFGRGVAFFSSRVSLFDLKGPFLRPDPQFARVGARRSCQGWPSRQPCGMLHPSQATP